MWYTGFYNNERQVGYATSPNGINWTKYGGNPVLTKGSSGSWDGSYVEAGTVMLLGDSVFMWYDGSREPTPTNLWRIGIATAPFVSVSVEQEITLLTEFTLEQNYPNPFNPKTTIGFGIQNKSNVKITVLNAIGEEVSLLLNEEKEAGFHQVEFNATGLPSGVYFYRLQAGSFTEIKKMVLLK
jgi:hypothetical protein